MNLISAVKGMFARKSCDIPGVSWNTINSWQFAPPTPRVEAERFAPVYACVKIISEEVARLNLRHLRKVDGRIVPVETSSAARVFRVPNSYQTRSDFWLSMLYALLFTGNAYAVALRNRRGEITSLWPQQSCRPMVDPQTGAVYYSVGKSDLEPFDPARFFPASDILHLRLFCPRNALQGESPIGAAMQAVVSGTSQRTAEAAFFTNMNRPSGVLSTDLTLRPEQVKALRESWDAQAANLNSGRVPILTAGLKWQPLGMTATDAQAVESYKMSVEDVARVFRMPLFMLGDYSKTTYSNTETMTRTFYVACLGFYLEHLEAALDRLFDFGFSDTAQFDIEQGLLRGDFSLRMDGLTKGVQGGVMSPNEARARENLPPVDGGDQVLVQQQMVPVNALGEEEEPEPEPEPAPDVERQLSEIVDFARKMLNDQ